MISKRVWRERLSQFMKKNKFYKLDFWYLSILCCVFFFVLKYVFDMFFYIKNIFSYWQYVEPAENENLVLSLFFNNFPHSGITDLIKNGIFPIYPDFYHRISTILPFEMYVNGRMVSVFASLGIFVLLASWFYKKHKSILVGVFFSICALGYTGHALYFFMQRVDALYIFLGAASLLLIWWPLRVNKSISQSLSNVPIINFIISGVIAALCVLTKQVGVIFVVVQVVPLITIFFYKSALFAKLCKLYFFYFISMAAAFLFYAFFVNREIAEYFYYGLKLYGGEYSDSSFFKHFNDAVKYYWFLLLIPINHIVYKKTLTKEWVYFILLLFTCVFFASFKMWGNLAAYANNFIFVSVFSVVVIIWIWDLFSKKEKLVLLTMTLFSMTIFNGYLYVPFFANSQSIVSTWAARLEEPDPKLYPIYKFLNTHRGNYLTTRLDNFLINSKNQVSYEASVMMPLLSDLSQISSVKRLNELVEFRKETLSNILNKNYTGVLVGIQKNAFIKEYPQLLQYYQPYLKNNMCNGEHCFEAILYVPK